MPPTAGPVRTSSSASPLLASSMLIALTTATASAGRSKPRRNAQHPAQIWESCFSPCLYRGETPRAPQGLPPDRHPLRNLSIRLGSERPPPEPPTPSCNALRPILETLTAGRPDG